MICEHLETLERPRTFINDSKHMEILCATCGKHIRYVTQKNLGDIVLYFGKYKGRLLTEVIAFDRSYAKWLFEKRLLNAWQTKALEDALNG